MEGFHCNPSPLMDRGMLERKYERNRGQDMGFGGWELKEQDTE